MCSERLDVTLVAVFEVRARERAQFGRERSAALCRELLGVGEQSEPERARGLREAAQIVAIERDVLDEDVGEGRKTFTRNGGQHAVDTSSV